MTMTPRFDLCSTGVNHSPSQRLGSTGECGWKWYWEDGIDLGLPPPPLALFLWVPVEVGFRISFSPMFTSQIQPLTRWMVASTARFVTGPAPSSFCNKRNVESRTEGTGWLQSTIRIGHRNTDRNCTLGCGLVRLGCSPLTHCHKYTCFFLAGYRLFN
jgi:hypothetical protein